MLDQPAVIIEERPAELKASPIPKDVLYSIAANIQASLADGFQWHDIVTVSKEAYHFVQMFHNLTVDEREQSIEEVVDIVIDNTDTPYLPDNFTDPIFKAIARPCIVLLFSKFEGLRPLPVGNPSESSPSSQDLQAFKSKTSSIFAIGAEWKDLFSLISLVIEFIEDYKVMTQVEKRLMAIKIVDEIIDETDTPYLPDTFSDPIFKAISRAVIEELIA